MTDSPVPSPSLPHTSSHLAQEAYPLRVLAVLVGQVGGSGQLTYLQGGGDKGWEQVHGKGMVFVGGSGHLTHLQGAGRGAEAWLLLVSRQVCNGRRATPPHPTALPTAPPPPAPPLPLLRPALTPKTTCCLVSAPRGNSVRAGWWGCRCTDPLLGECTQGEQRAGQLVGLQVHLPVAW